MTDYLTVDGVVESEFEVSRSRFISHIAPAADGEAANKFIDGIRKRYTDATHIVYAYVGAPYTNEAKASDDGEPQGTAGQPVMSVLSKNGIYGAVITVTRYFGGIKLGAGGLTGAYKKAASDVLQKAVITEARYSEIFTVPLSYSEYKMVLSYIKASEINVSDTEYGENVKLTLTAPVDAAARAKEYLKSLTKGRDDIITNDYKYINYAR